MRSDHKPRSETSTEMYDVPELARMLRVSEDFIRAQVQQRRIPYYKVGKLIRFDPREITDWLAASESRRCAESCARARSRWTG